ncbi:MAG: methylmalonyl Co-A mutase-associated GTPase MeaB [Gemmatimonadota bacterium]
MTPLEALTPALEDVLERFRSGARLGLARAISAVEGERPGFQALLHAVTREGLQGRRIGVTGPPGAGKSSLVAQMATHFRTRGETVGIVAVDPTSPFSGGALLGDRIRMNDLATDPGIFIRSMATRGSLGGLAMATEEVIDLMDGFGFDRVIVETVGVGQTELEIQSAADTVLVALVPESGDGIQAMKAGLMEIADIFVVNKADRPGADRLAKELSFAIHLRAGEALKDVPAHHGVQLDAVRKDRTRAKAPAEPQGWQIPVLKTVAQTGEGLPELLEAIDRHRDHLEATGELRRRRRTRAEGRVVDVVERQLGRLAWSRPGAQDILQDGLDRIESGAATPYSVAESVVQNMLAPKG